MKRLFIVFGLILLSFIYSSCSFREADFNEKIVGTWEVTNISELQHVKLPAGFWIKFYDDGTFESGWKKKVKFQSGFWNVDKINSLLVLESNENSHEASSWFIKLKDLKMNWQWASSGSDIELQFEKTKEVQTYNLIDHVIL